MMNVMLQNVAQRRFVFVECKIDFLERSLRFWRVRVCYYWQRLFSFTEVQVKFVLANAVF